MEVTIGLGRFPKNKRVQSTIAPRCGLEYHVVHRFILIPYGDCFDGGQLWVYDIAWQLRSFRWLPHWHSWFPVAAAPGSAGRWQPRDRPCCPVGCSPPLMAPRCG